ncbi:MAG TPA: hypothetical protein VGQ03_04295 [Nitrososphaera sp.]|jgi:hypothetical protein|nr:hypothetical protein [Nitrososphaera sp.]
MISVKYALIIAISAFAAGAFVVSPVPQAIAAVIATDVQCTGCVGTSDLAGNAVTSVKIKDGEVKAADIAANAVGSSEIATGAVGSPEVLDSTIKSSDLASAAVLNVNLATAAVTSIKIADDSVLAVDIAPDAVGASELQGVSKLIFAECSTTSNSPTSGDAGIGFGCTVSGADTDDHVIATKNDGNQCFAVTLADVTSANTVTIVIQNVKSVSCTLGTAHFSVIVYDT